MNYFASRLVTVEGFDFKHVFLGAERFELPDLGTSFLFAEKAAFFGRLDSRSLNQQIDPDDKYLRAIAKELKEPRAQYSFRDGILTASSSLPGAEGARVTLFQVGYRRCEESPEELLLEAFEHMFEGIEEQEKEALKRRAQLRESSRWVDSLPDPDSYSGAEHRALTLLNLVKSSHV